MGSTQWDKSHYAAWKWKEGLPERIEHSRLSTCKPHNAINYSISKISLRNIMRCGENETISDIHYSFFFSGKNLRVIEHGRARASGSEWKYAIFRDV